MQVRHNLPIPKTGMEAKLFVDRKAARPSWQFYRNRIHSIRASQSSSIILLLIDRKPQRKQRPLLKRHKRKKSLVAEEREGKERNERKRAEIRSPSKKMSSVEVVSY